jgi:hypothetical protein
VDSCAPAQRDALLHELRNIKQISLTGINAGRTSATDRTWTIWETFCRDLHCDPYLTTLHDPIPILQIFANRYRTGTVAPSGNQVRSRTVEDALRAVGQTFASLGCADPRLQASGKLDLRLSRLLSAYKKQDPPPTRVKPIPLPIVAHAAHLCYTANTPSSNTIADMLLLGFFFLLRPGEYAFTNNPDAAPFRLCDTHLLINSRRLQPANASFDDLQRVNYVALEFTTQKNGVRGELIGLGRSGHPTWCPVKTLINRIQHLRQQNAPPTTPLYSYFDGSWRRIDTTILTHYLRLAVTTLGHQYGISAPDVSIRSLRSSGAMALLCAKVDTDMIRLLGRWRSDEMLRYLHVQSFPLVAPLASQMLHHGHFTLMPNQINGG